MKELKKKTLGKSITRTQGREDIMSLDARALGPGHSVLPPGELDETYASSLILAYSLHYMKRDVIHKTRSTERIALPLEWDQAAATDNMYIKIREISSRGY